MTGLRLSIRRMIDRALKDSRFQCDNMFQLADRMSMSMDAFNNRLYGQRSRANHEDCEHRDERIDEMWALSIYNDVRLRCPEIARDFLQEYWRDSSIDLRDHALLPRSGVGFNDLAHLALELGSITGNLEGFTADAISDGRITPKEARVALDLCSKINSLAADVKVALVNSLNNSTGNS